MTEMVYALGLMSGTSLDGIDAALIRTDGRDRVEAGAHLTAPYPEAFRDRLRAVLGTVGGPEVTAVEGELTRLHADAVAALLDQAGLAPDGVDLIGFHGHTIHHAPDRRVTRQIGDGALLAALTGIPVVNDFRSADVAAGGQGAPLVPLYHRALAAGLPRPVALLNIGGVANVTWLGADDDAVLGFDTGPGNALIDDWVRAKAGLPYDADGAVAASGTVDQTVLDGLMAHAYFTAPAPKSLDRDAFDPSPVAHLSPADGAATLTHFTAAAVAACVAHLPEAPRTWLACGGGRHNRALMRALSDRLGVTVGNVDDLGWSGDALEAQAFAYLAVRSRHGLPLSLPGTTGVPAPQTGGRYHPGPMRTAA
ncbi:anhydro-N-acetylmuramic acid kinase [Azospirillum sp. B4]|uniref:anhydro-N-acetylmuramic acid kinase n=1 Tax=Azospirillum sp. B4 TaxID=95605 RepID=UPI000347ADA0|nr:anhydro-N-acetylmuramic acid kinase [Azospirillum sp. B4]